jgi:hypothetical protein
MKITGLLLFLLQIIAGSAAAQTNTDTCHVYIIDNKATAEFREKTDFGAFAKKSKQEQEAILNAAGVGKTFDAFTTKVGEEELTTKTFPFPKGKYVITASIFYTDESLVSTNTQDSMLMAITVGPKPLDEALSAPDAAVLEVSYNEGTDVVRVKKNIIIDGRLYVVGMECHCKNKVKK